MIRATGQIRIDRPPEVVFDFLADLSNELTFNPAARGIVKVTEGEIGLDTRYTETVKPLGFFEVRICEYVRPRLLGFEATNRRVDITVRFRFASVNGATEMSVELAMTPKGMLRTMTPLLAPMARYVTTKQRGPRIKQAVESRT